MKNKTYIILILIITNLFVIGCSKPEDKQYLSVVMKDEYAQKITGDTIPVELNSTHQTLIEVTYTGRRIYFLRQIDQGKLEILKEGETFSRSSPYGRYENGRNTLEAIITTDFSDSLMHVGSIVRVSARMDMVAAESVYYRITD